MNAYYNPSNNEADPRRDSADPGAAQYPPDDWDDLLEESG
jgi:hypothetical protein